MPIPFDSRVRICRDVLMSELDGQSVLLNVQSECYFGLDHVGTRIWELLQSSDSIQRAYDTLASEYDVDPETLRLDLIELLESLIQQGLVEVVSA